MTFSSFVQRFEDFIEACITRLIPPLLLVMGGMLILVSFTGQNLEWMAEVFRIGGITSFGLAALWTQNTRFERIETRIDDLEKRKSDLRSIH